MGGGGIFKKHLKDIPGYNYNYYFNLILDLELIEIKLSWVIFNIHLDLKLLIQVLFYILGEFTTAKQNPGPG